MFKKKEINLILIIKRYNYNNHFLEEIITKQFQKL
jgi:hypothetical protein